MWNYAKPFAPLLRSFVPLLAVVALAGCQAGRSGGSVAFEREPWQFGGHPGTRLLTEHYDIRTTVTDENVLETIPHVVEAAHDYYTDLLPPARTVDERLPLYLFERRTEWTRFTDMTFPPEVATRLKRVRNGGYSYKGIAALQYTTNARTFPLLTHEGLHQYVHYYLGTRPPAWLSEGLAVCAEGMKWTGSTRIAFDPWHIPERRNVLATRLGQNRLIPLPRLLRMHPGDTFSGRPGAADGYYAQVWMLVLFLQHGADGRYAPDYLRLREALHTPNPERFARAAFIRSPSGSEYDYGEYLFRNFISSDLATVEKEFQAFLRQELLNAR